MTHRFPSDDHFRSWVETVKRDLTEVKRRRALPQTKTDHKTLAERQKRYEGYLKQAEAVTGKISS